MKCRISLAILSEKRRVFIDQNQMKCSISTRRFRMKCRNSIVVENAQTGHRDASERDRFMLGTSTVHQKATAASMLAGSETAAIASGSAIPSLGSRAASAPSPRRPSSDKTRSSCPDIATPFFMRLSKAPNYTPGDLAYFLTRKTPESGGFEGLAHLYVHCPATSLPSVPAATAPYSASAASSRRATSSMRMASPCLAPATERPMSTPMPVM